MSDENLPIRPLLFPDPPIWQEINLAYMLDTPSLPFHDNISLLIRLAAESLRLDTAELTNKLNGLYVKTS